MLADGTAEPPAPARAEKAEPHRDEILALHKSCKGNLVRTRDGSLQFYPRFTRFECKVFLRDAAQYHDGTCETCMIDNTARHQRRGLHAAERAADVCARRRAARQIQPLRS